VARKKKRTEKPKWVKALSSRRNDAIALAEEWIYFRGGDRKKRDPGLDVSLDSPVVDFFESAAAPQILQQLERAAASTSESLGDLDLDEGEKEETPMEQALLRGGLAWHAPVRWANFGMPAFILDPDTAGMLALTDVDRLDVEDVHLPFPTFVLVLEPGAHLNLTLRRHKTQRVPVDLIWVHTYERDGDRMLEIVAEAKGGGEAEVMLPFPEKNGKVAEWVDLYGQGLALAVEAMEREGDPVAAREQEQVMQDMMALIRLVVSFAMLFRSEGGTPHKPLHGISRAQYDQSELPLPKDWRVAQVRMPSQVKKALRETGQIRGGVVTARHVVRGHWKMQRHGAGRTLLKPIKIDPYWRGVGPEALTKTTMPRRKKKNPTEKAALFRRLMRL